jgi:hypothetical protein
VNFINGVATSTFNGGNVFGVSNITATVDSQTVNTQVSIGGLYITSVNPINGATNVPIITNNVTITFGTNIQSGSAYNGIYIWNNNLNTGKMINPSIQGNQLIITVVYNWMPNTNYTIYVPINAVTDQYGNTLATNFNSTLNTAPLLSVNSVNPSNGATNVPITTKNLTITFNEAIQPGSAYNTIYLWNNNLNYGKTITTSIQGNQLVIALVYNWEPNSNYTIYIPVNSVIDQYGNSIISNFTSNFTINPLLNVTSVSPANGAINVPITTQNVTITFNEAIQPGSAYNNIYIYNNALNSYKTITTSIKGNTLIITAVTNWNPNTNYVIYIPSNALTDAEGNTLSAGFRSTLTTA